ncbi:hypothetical protein V6N11_082313 [Hibiscus sabdariffa]
MSLHHRMLPGNPLNRLQKLALLHLLQTKHDSSMEEDKDSTSVGVPSARQKLNFPSNTQACSSPTKKAKDKSLVVPTKHRSSTIHYSNISEAPKKTRTKTTFEHEPQLPREFYEKVGSISTSFESRKSPSTHASDVFPAPSALVPMGLRIKHKVTKSTPRAHQ